MSESDNTSCFVDQQLHSYYLLFCKTRSNVIIKAAYNVTYRPMVRAVVIGQCYRPLIQVDVAGDCNRSMLQAVTPRCHRSMLHAVVIGR